jgi:hypothetical protein
MSRGMIAALVLITAIAAGLLGFGAWASASLPGSFGGTPWIWLAMIGGALTVAALTAGLMWLAFFSARKGYDDRADEHMGRELDR